MEKKDWHILPECYIDTNLIEFLLGSNGVNHQKGCNFVAKQMNESKLKDMFSIGIIDNDKRQPTYVSEFTIVAQSQHIELLKHKSRPHFIIRITLAMDQFIIDCASETSVRLEEFGLPSTLEALTKVTKDVKAKNDYRFKSLFNAVSHSNEMVILRSVIKYLNTHRYQSNTEEIIGFFQSQETGNPTTDK